ncbi:hypothetical protein [Pseudomonas lopnurensis]|uniref:hypothetical protein n=1 Tax=Pseudomonas lopnurensis TaxID=1477517 RepID=UPI0028A672AB|nr:hypothetical protein [Pseudomonas lopnurensis]
MFLNKALSLPSLELHLVQTILEEATAMHSDPVAVRDQVLDVLQLNLQQSDKFVLDHFGYIVDELLAHMAMPTEKLMLAIALLREAGFEEEADLLKPAIFDRTQLVRSTPGLETRLRDIFNHCPACSNSELHSHDLAWRALEHLTFHSQFRCPKALQRS